ncbi:unnamed protein product [Sphenostylis stenocarpa]|uniref:DUF8039 domain-containing protein n=1 Tax=Sphenostylis stenocarpa TaxID=92480 RepID=A0AA86SM70_9FABA|nr:unnamed protein product [Sphenostylis stenocarpa]
MEMQFEEKLNQIRQSLQQEFDEKIESLARSQQQTQGTPQTIEHDVVRVNTKGSCAATTIDPSGKYTQTDASHQCELYVEDDPPRLVAIGRVFEGGLTIHGVPLQAEWTRVVVDEVHDANAPVPFPNEEIQLVGQASRIFLAWPRRLVMPLSAHTKEDLHRAKHKKQPIIDEDLTNVMMIPSLCC